MESRRANKPPARKPRPVLRKLLAATALLALLGSAAAVGGVLYLQSQGISPRALAPYIEKRSSGHNPVIVGAGQWVSNFLVAQDRPEPGVPAVVPAGLGAQETALSSVPAGATSVSVATSDEVRRALAAAGPGKVITLLPGTYRFEGPALEVTHGGAPNAPAILRADLPGSVIIEMNLTEGFQVSAPHWIFENLVIRGACSAAGNCEHAFHVTGGGHHFAALNNTITDFNAHFKINGSGGEYPDNGRIIGNTINNTAPRKTAHPVTPIDLVAASGWLIAQNLIADFVKTDGDRISYGGFAKGAGSDNRFSRNAVLCEHRLQGHPGQRVGLSLGGGGTGKEYCRDKRCIVEQERSVIEGNLVAACSDAGIYLNNAAGSRVSHNSVIDTAGMQLRFPATSAMVEGNLIDGAVAAHNDAVVRLEDNLTTSIAMSYAGRHRLRERYRAPQDLDFSWKEDAPRRPTAVVPGRDLCGNERPPAHPAYGAIEDFSACLKPRKLEPLPPPRPRRPLR